MLSTNDKEEEELCVGAFCVLRLRFASKKKSAFFFVSSFGAFRERERETIRFDLNRIRVVFFSLSLFLSVSVSLFPDDDDDDDDDDEHSM